MKAQKTARMALRLEASEVALFEALRIKGNHKSFGSMVREVLHAECIRLSVQRPITDEAFAKSPMPLFEKRKKVAKKAKPKKAAKKPAKMRKAG